MKKGLTLCLALLGLATALVAFATLVGLGVLREGPLWAVMISAAAVVLLPIAAVGQASRNTAEGWVSGLVLWPVMVYTAIPLFFPGERADGVAAGFGAIAAATGSEATMTRSAAFGEGVARLLGPELLKGRPPATPVVAVEPDESPAPPASPSIDVQMNEDDSIALPYEGAGRSLKVPVVFDADGSHELWMLFDTGATYTTLSQGRLERMGVEVPADAPSIVLNTANGEIEAPIVMIERAWLGGFPVEGLTVAVCEDCAGEDHEGLLGLNVSGQFSVTLDPGRQEMLLKPAQGTDRTLDVAHWLDISAMTYRYPDGRVEVEVEVGSTSDRTVEEAVVTIDCAGTLFEARVEAIPGQGVGTDRVALPRDSGCEETLIQLKSAHW